MNIIKKTLGVVLEIIRTLILAVVLVLDLILSPFRKGGQDPWHLSH